MSEQQHEPHDPPLATSRLAEVADESAEESVAAERAAVGGDQPDVGGIVDEDGAQ